MKRNGKVFALALGTLMAVSVFAACGGGQEEPDDDVGGVSVASARICYDNLGKGYVSEADKQAVVKGATNLKAYNAEGDSVPASEIATYNEKSGLFTAVSEGRVLYTLPDGSRNRLDVLPAYTTDPGNQYSGNVNNDTNKTSGAAHLGNTHDPSFIEVNNNGNPEYYLFSTGWNTGNDIHISYDGMLTWEYIGKPTTSGDFSDPDIFPQDLKSWMNASNNNSDISWWAPDIVEAKGGGYWFYTCLTMSDEVQKRTQHSGSSVSPSTYYSQACIVMYHFEKIATDENGKFDGGTVEYKGVLMQSAIPQNGQGAIDVNGIDPQIITSPDGKMYMAYGSFGTGNWIIELDPETGLRKDGDNEFHDWEWVRRERNKVVTGDETQIGTMTLSANKIYTDFMGGKTVQSGYYGTLISLGAMEGPTLNRHDNVKVADETATYDKNGEPQNVTGKTFYYTMHSYNWLASNYQMWGGRSESVWGTYRSTGGGLVYNNDVGRADNQGNKYMGAFRWRDDAKSESCKEYDFVLPGHNDIYTTKNNINMAAYINRTFDGGSEKFLVQLHQYYLNSKGDICINLNRYGNEIDRGVSEEELFALTDNGKFEMVALTNAQDATIISPGNNASLQSINNVSFGVRLDKDTHKIFRDDQEIGSFVMYGRGYIKFTFTETLKGSGSYDTGETVYYGVVRPTWLANQNRSGFTISCMGNTQNKQNMAMFMNSYPSNDLSGSGFVGE